MRTSDLELQRSTGPAGPARATLRFIGNATMLLHLNGVTILTDPNFLHAGDHAHIGYGMTTRRLREPACRLDEIGAIDAVLLSHYHGDHFDHKVEAALSRTLPIVTTPQAAAVLARKGFRNTMALRTWASVEVRKGDRSVRITSMPGKHGPGALSALLPQVMGSLIDVPQPAGRPLRIYISGDTLIFDELREIPKRYPDIDVAVIHLGGTRVMGVVVTLDGKGGVEAVRIIDPRIVIPVHYEEYTVMKSPLSDFFTAAEQAGLGGKIRTLARGETIELAGERRANASRG